MIGRPGLQRGPDDLLERPAAERGANVYDLAIKQTELPAPDSAHYLSGIEHIRRVPGLLESFHRLLAVAPESPEAEEARTQLREYERWAR
jgi:hypothetical protein